MLLLDEMIDDSDFTDFFVLDAFEGILITDCLDFYNLP